MGGTSERYGREMQVGAARVGSARGGGANRQPVGFWAQEIAATTRFHKEGRATRMKTAWAQTVVLHEVVVLPKADARFELGMGAQQIDVVLRKGSLLSVRCVRGARQVEGESRGGETGRRLFRGHKEKHKVLPSFLPHRRFQRLGRRR